MPGPLTPELLAFGLATAGDPRISPDGSRIVYTLSTVDPDDHRTRRRVWICRIDGSDVAPLTSETTDAGGARWSSDGTRIALGTTGEDGCALVVIDLEGTDRELVRHAQALGELAWSPDDTRIAYTTLFDPDNPDEFPERPGAAPKVRVTRRLDFKEDGRGYLGDRRKQVFVAQLADGSRRRLTSPPSEHDAPQWSPDGRSLGIRVHLPDRVGSRIVVDDVDSGGREEIGPGTGPVGHWAWSPDGDRLLFAADPEHELQPDYYLHDRRSGATVRVTNGVRHFPDDAPPVWLDDRRALVHGIEAGASVLATLDVETGELEPIERPQARNAGLSVDRRQRLTAQAQSSLESTGELRVLDLETRSATTITRYNARLLEQHPPADWEAFTVLRDGFELDAWLLKPPDFDPSRRYPVVLDVHGGPNGNYGYGFIAHEQCLATHGFLVVYSNPRGSTSYGAGFAQQVVEDWGRGDHDDVMAVLDAVLERPYADAERTGIFGISYGGYMTAWAISQSNRFKAAVCGEPIFDLESDWGTSDVAFLGLERYGGGPPHERREWYAAHSPSTYAHQTRTPTLIFHGEADARCPIGQSEQMFVALRKAGCEVEYVRYPGGSHMFFAQGLPEHRADFLARTVAWFEEHLGGSAA